MYLNEVPTVNVVELVSANDLLYSPSELEVLCFLCKFIHHLLIVYRFRLVLQHFHRRLVLLSWTLSRWKKGLNLISEFLVLVWELKSND